MSDLLQRVLRLLPVELRLEDLVLDGVVAGWRHVRHGAPDLFTMNDQCKLTANRNSRMLSTLKLISKILLLKF